MKDEQSELDKLEAEVDKVLSPERAMRWGVRILVAIITLGAIYGVGRVVWHMVGKVDKAVDEVEQQEQDEAKRAAEAAEVRSLNHNWFVLKNDEISAASIEVQSAVDALARHRVLAANRGLLDFKGKEDKQEEVRLQGVVAAAQTKRLNLIRDYNAKALKVEASMLGDLPAHFEVAPLLETPTEGN